MTGGATTASDMKKGITIGDWSYRGIWLVTSKKNPALYKITCCGKGKAGNWHTYKEFKTSAEAEACWATLEKQAAEYSAEVEVLAPAPTAVAIADPAAAKVTYFEGMASAHAGMSVMCAAAAGAVILQKQDTAKRGTFLPWLRDLKRPNGEPFAQRTAYRYMSLAGEIAKRIQADPTKLPRVATLLAEASSSYSAPGAPGRAAEIMQTNILEALAQFDPSRIHEPDHIEIAEMVAKVTNEQALQQLYFSWGICKEPGKLGGYHPKNGPKLTPAEEVAQETELNRKLWARILGDLRAWGIMQTTWNVLSKSEKEQLIGTLRDIATAVQKSVK